MDKPHWIDQGVARLPLLLTLHSVGFMTLLMVALFF